MSKIYAVRQFYYGPSEEGGTDDGIIATFCTKEEAQERADFEADDAREYSSMSHYYAFVVEEQDE